MGPPSLYNQNSATNLSWRLRVSVMSYHHSLYDRLTAIRNRRPGIQTAEPRGNIARRLLRDVMGLSNEIAILEWLEMERNETVATLALGVLLERIGHLYYSGSPKLDAESDKTAFITRIRESGQDSNDIRLFSPTQENGRLASMSVDGLHSESDIEEMLRTLEDLRKQTVPTDELITSLPGGVHTPRSLLNEVMRLPSREEPIHWLRFHHASLCSRIVLDYLITSVMPVDQMYREAMTLPCRKSRPFTVRALSKGRIKIDFRDLTMIEDGFVLRIWCRYRRSRAAPLPTPNAIVRWEGFRHVTDDAGHTYVPLPVVHTSSNHLWWQTQEMMMICWPTIKNSRELMFTSKPAFLSIYHPSGLDGELLYQRGANMGDMSYVVPMGPN